MLQAVQSFGGIRPAAYTIVAPPIRMPKQRMRSPINSSSSNIMDIHPASMD